MVEDSFRLPGSSYEQLTQIVQAYGHLDKAVGAQEVADTLGIDQTQVSRNNRFLVSIGVIDGGKKKQSTGKGKQLARALDHNLPGEIRSQWRELVVDHEFMEKILAAVRIRNGMEPSNLETHIAYTAGQKKTSRSVTGARAVIDILNAAGVLREHDGKIVAVEEEVTLSARPDKQVTPRVDVGDREVGRSGGGNIAAGWVGPPVGIQLQIQCTVDEIEGLAPKLRKLIEALSRSGSDPTSRD